MGVQNKGLSSLSIVLILAVLCIGSYLLGLKHGAGRYADGAATDQTRAAATETGSDVEEAASLPFKDESGSRRIIEDGAGEVERSTDIESEQKQRLMRNITANLENPGMNRIIQEQQRVLMADKYRKLIDAYDLNDKEKEYFLDLLTARQMIHVDMGMKLMTGMLSEAERNELLEQVGTDLEEMSKEIDWFLNSATDSEYFQYYERTEGERALVDAVSTHLSQAGSPLSDGLDDELVAIMHGEISEYPFSVEFEESGEPVFSRFTDENIDLFVGEMQSLRDPLMEQASQVLDPQQFEVFAGSFDQYVAFYEQRLRMVQGLFNPAQ